MKSEHIDAEERMSSEKVALDHVDIIQDPDADLSDEERARVVWSYHIPLLNPSSFNN